MKKIVCSLVRKCIYGDVCDNFKEYFAINNHSMRTRNQKHLLKLPKVRLEFARNSFYYTGAKLYNDLSIKIRDSSKNERMFKAFIDAHFT